MKTSICYAHAKFWRNSSVFGHKIATQNAKTTYDKFFIAIFDVLDHPPLGVTAGHRQQRLYRPLDEVRRGMHLVVNHFQLILKRSRYSFWR